MQNIAAFLRNLTRSMALTVALTLAVCLAISIWVPTGIEETIMNALGMGFLLAIVVAFVFAECWYEAKLGPRAAAAIYLVHYLLACFVAMAYWGILHSG